VLGVRRRLLGRVGELDAAGLHPPAAQHLGLDHHRPADLLGGPARLLGAPAKAVLGDGNPRQLDDLACLELVEPHRGAGPYPTASARVCSSTSMRCVEADAWPGRRAVAWLCRLGDWDTPGQ